MKSVGIYRKAFLKTSEVFIREQVSHLQSYDPIFIGCTYLKQIPFPGVYIDSGSKINLRKYLYLLTRSPRYLGNLQNLKDLALIHAHFGPDGAYAMAIADRLSIPFCVTFHGYDITLNRDFSLLKRPLYYQLLLHEKQLQQKASAFIAVSNFIHQKLLEKGYPAAKIIQHYIGVDTEKFFPVFQKPQERYILCVGRHTEKKGVDVLLRAFAKIAAKHKDVSLLQVGSGRLTAQLYALAKSLKITDRVHFLGAQSHEQVLKLMQGAEIFALPSHTARDGDCEALGIVFQEASACGIPVVSTWHGGIPEAVLDGKTGFLVPEKDDVALAEKLDLLLTDRTLSEQIGRQGREFVCEFFDIRKQTAKLENIYNSILHLV